MSLQRKLAIIPAFNEERNVADVVERVRAYGYDVVVVDDGSGDHTAQRASEAGAKVLRLPINLGYGGALQTGYLFARDNGYELAVQLDADGQHDPASLDELLRPIQEGVADVVIGSRFLGGGSYRASTLRRAGQKLFGAIAGLVTKTRITDPTSGMQALSRSVLRIYCLRLFPDDYPDADMFVILHRLGFRVLEIPVTMTPNERTSMHSGPLRAIYYVYKMSLAMIASAIKKLPPRENG